MPHKDPEARRAYRQQYKVKSRRHKPPRRCAVCAVVFKPFDTGTNRVRYCSPECAEAAKHARNLDHGDPVNNYSAAALIEQAERRAQAAVRRENLAALREIKARERAVEARERAVAKQEKRAERDRVMTKACAVCGKSFRARNSRQLYCSDECERAIRAERAKARYDPAKARERYCERRDSADPEAWRASWREQASRWRKAHPEHKSTEAVRRWRAKQRERE